ncbi:MAG: hypothetical protein ABSD48_10160 [Armatimonadota bacterium]|jgi:hypothetical protein
MTEGAVVLRPMGLLEIIDQAFRLYRRNFWLFFGIAAFVYVPLGLVQAVPALAALSVIVLLPAYFVASGALTKAVSDRYMGYPVTVGAAYRFVLKRFGPFLLTLLAAFALILSGAILLFVGMVVFAFWAAFVMQVFIIEDKRYFRAVWRSRFLIGQGVWAQLVVLLIITSVIASVIQYVPLGALVLASAAGKESAVMWLIMGMVMGISNALVLPITLISVIMLYYDSRIRKEGFDLETLARELGRPAPQASIEAPIAPETPASPPGDGGAM